jgi:hypothetical protein
MAKSRKEAAAPDATLEPRIGDRVSIGSSDTIYIITRASADGKDVDVNLPGTSLERFRVPVEDLKFIDLAPRTPSKPAKPSINIEEVRERLATAQHTSMDQLSGDVAVLKKYLKSKRVPAEAAEELDRLCKDAVETWRTAVAKIAELLEE